MNPRLPDDGCLIGRAWDPSAAEAPARTFAAAALMRKLAGRGLL